MIWINCKGIYILVLIDTWWNVNKFRITNFGSGRNSFNRYMVECKFIYCSFKIGNIKF